MAKNGTIADSELGSQAQLLCDFHSDFLKSLNRWAWHVIQPLSQINKCGSVYVAPIMLKMHLECLNESAPEKMEHWDYEDPSRHY